MIYLYGAVALLIAGLFGWGSWERGEAIRHQHRAAAAEAVAQSDAVVLVVPLFVDADGVPDFEWMDAATRAVAPGGSITFQLVGTTWVERAFLTAAS